MANKYLLSDELLAAYLEGNTSQAETLQVLQALKTDPILRETLAVAISLEEKHEMALPMIQMAAESGENLCGVMCEAYIFGRRGIAFEEDDLLITARDNHWLKDNGTPLHAIGQLLANAGLLVTRKYDATIDDIVKSLERNNDVIVAVDRDKLYPELPDEEDATNHAVVVTAIDPDDQIITLYDPKQFSSRLESLSSHSFQLSTFENAWKESQNYMVRVLQSVEEYEPQPINLDTIPLGEDLNELIEAIAENAHDIWALARMKEGWTYGPVRDDAKRQTPCLVPYEQLPEEEKAYDRNTAFGTLKFIVSQGFEIHKT